ncbi:MAG: acyl-CoA dehydrogenase family protein [Elusimicrobia bacterium]|nr:acyl-CoA dehydrogenase family protein [Elusimicrobiota bacterium]
MERPNAPGYAGQRLNPAFGFERLYPETIKGNGVKGGMNFELTQTQREVLETFHEFCAKRIAPRAREIDESEEYPLELFREMGRLGYLGLAIPEQYGGMGLDYVTCSLIAEELSRASTGFGLSVGAHSFLCAQNLYNMAGESQRQKYLPGLCNGELIGAFGLTEPEAGSDSTNLSTHAVKKGNEWIINGAKMFITNGSIADVILLFARTQRKPGSQGVSVFIVEKNFPGFSTGRDIKKLGTHGSPLSELVLQDCRVPEENLMGKEGRGLSYMLKALDIERALLSGMAVGGAQAALDCALDYSKKRRQFGQLISSFQLIQEMLAQMATEIEAARLLVRQAAWRLDQGLDITRHASYAKLFSAQMAMRAARQAMQILGGAGYCCEFPAERFYRDAPLMGLGGGTNEIQKLIIARDLIKNGLRPTKPGR